MTTSVNSQLVEVISGLFNISLSSITLNLAAGEIDKWDSLGHFNLILTIEQHFGVKFKTDRIPDLLTVKLLQEELMNKGAI